MIPDVFKGWPRLFLTLAFPGFYFVAPTFAQEVKISAPPVYDGLAAAAGRVYLARSDGRLTCFGKRD